METPYSSHILRRETVARRSRRNWGDVPGRPPSALPGRWAQGGEGAEPRGRDEGGAVLKAGRCRGGAGRGCGGEGLDAGKGRCQGWAAAEGCRRGAGPLRAGRVVGGAESRNAGIGGEGPDAGRGGRRGGAERPRSGCQGRD